MNKIKSKITISIDNDIDEKLEKGNFNKSKLIDSLLKKWLLLNKKDLKKK